MSTLADSLTITASSDAGNNSGTGAVGYAVAPSLGGLTDNQSNIINMVAGVGSALSGTINNLHPTLNNNVILPRWLFPLALGIVLILFLKPSGSRR
ncbi:MAG TPA: hypothetical protein VIL78_00680 [Hanamia sp.]